MAAEAVKELAGMEALDLSDGGDGLETDVWGMGPCSGNPLSQSMKYVPISRQQPGLAASPGRAAALPQPHGGAFGMAGAADTAWSASAKVKHSR